jgi:hypothetical protein
MKSGRFFFVFGVSDAPIGDESLEMPERRKNLSASEGVRYRRRGSPRRRARPDWELGTRVLVARR